MEMKSSDTVARTSETRHTWYDLSRYRSELMGLAMLVVMLFHTPLSRKSAWYGLMRLGNDGVDVFLFLSGIGLWYAWQKCESEPFGRRTLRFYWRRYIRIYPAWLIAACLYYIPQYLPSGGGYSPTVADLIANILINWSFWRADDLTFWFIPCIMMLYTIAPFYLYAIRKWPACQWIVVVAMVWYLLVRSYQPLWQSVGHVEIFWSRIPVFLLGINAAAWVKDRRAFDRSTIWLLFVLFAACLWYCFNIESHRRSLFPPATERLVYIPLAVSGMLLACRLFAFLPSVVLRALRFLGGISLELYLVHVQFVLVNIRPMRLGYWPTFLLMLVISIPLAWLLSRLAKLIARPLPENILTK